MQGPDPAPRTPRAPPAQPRERPLFLAAFYLLLTYAFASFPTGVVAGVLWSDLDVRDAGSGNIGATNVARLLGPTLGGLTLLGDLLKGLLPVLLAPLVVEAPWYGGLVAIAAFTGHCYSIFLGFRGGKGVATGAGAMLGLAPWAVLVCLVAWAGVFAWRRTSSLAGLVAAALLSPLVWLLHPDQLWAALALFAGIVLRHLPNIRRLLEGREQPL